MNLEIETPENLDWDLINLSEPKKKSEKYISNFYYDYKPLLIQTPKFLISQISPRFLSLDLENSVNLKIFFLKLEDYVKEKIYQNSPLWFKGKKLQRVDINERYKTNFLSRTTYRICNNKNASFFDHKNEHKNWTELSKNTLSMAILHIKNIWFSREECGITVELIQLKTFINRKFKLSKLDTCLINNQDNVEDSDEDSDEEREEEPKEEPKEEVKEEPKEEPKEEVKEEPKEEVKEEPKEEVKEEALYDKKDLKDNTISYFFWGD